MTEAKPPVRHGEAARFDSRLPDAVSGGRFATRIQLSFNAMDPREAVEAYKRQIVKYGLDTWIFGVQDRETGIYYFVEDGVAYPEDEWEQHVAEDLDPAPVVDVPSL